MPLITTNSIRADPTITVAGVGPTGAATGDRSSHSNNRPRPQLGTSSISSRSCVTIRSRISERQGVDLTAQQIQELAARRLEAILDPRTIKPSLMDELRRAAGLPADAAPPEPEGDQSFDESALYKSDSGFLRFVRRLLNPLLKLLFNPTAIVEALNTQSQRAKAIAAREAEQRRRQTEWNALHFEILRRLVTDVARVEIDNQHLAHRVESLTARVDFNERRVRGFEHTQHQSQSRPAGAPTPPWFRLRPSPLHQGKHLETRPATTEPASAEASTEGSRRRRRRRRGRRSGQPREIGGVPTAALTALHSGPGRRGRRLRRR